MVIINGSSSTSHRGSRSCQVRGDPGTNRVQTTSPNTSQRQPISTNISAAHRSSRPLKPWSASSQRRYISQRNATQPKHALAGRAGLRDARPPARAGLGRCGQGVGSRRPPPGLPRGAPGAEPYEVAAGRVEGCPRGAAWSGYARSTGSHTAPSVQDHPWSLGMQKRITTSNTSGCWFKSGEHTEMSRWGPLGDHTFCAEADDPHVGRSCARRLHPG